MAIFMAIPSFHTSVFLVRKRSMMRPIRIEDQLHKCQGCESWSLGVEKV